MSNNKFPWHCGDCPMLKTYDMSIDDLTHICLWSKKQIDDCDRYKSAECPMEKHDSELLDKVLNELEELKQEFKNDRNIHGAIAVNISIKRIKQKLKDLEKAR